MDWLQDPLEQLQWGILHWVATLCWNLDRLLLMGAVLIHTVRKWITQPSGIINMVTTYLLQDEGSVSLKTYIAGAILLALLLASFVFILRPLIGSDHNPVDLRKVFIWLAVVGYLFSTGPAFFSDMEQFRAQLSSSAYQVASSVNGNVGGGGKGYNNTQGEVPVGSSEPFSPTVQLFPNTTHVYDSNSRQPEYTGVDVAAAYLFATQEDVNGTVNGGTGLPEAFENQYFTNDNTRPWPSNYNEPQRQAALSNALTGVVRISTGIVPSVFAIQQAIIFLALAIAAAVLIFSLPISLVFAFFSATEVIALSVVRAYVSLLIKTYVVAMILAIFMGFLKFWADSQNWVAFLGMSLLILFFTWQLAHLAIQTITQSLNVVTQAIGEATGTQMKYFDPIGAAGQTVGQGVGLAATVGIAAATGGAGMAAGSLVSGLGGVGVGMGIPGMRGMQTLGYGLTMSAVRNKREHRAGQDADENPDQSNQSNQSRQGQRAEAGVSGPSRASGPSGSARSKGAQSVGGAGVRNAIVGGTSLIIPGTYTNGTSQIQDALGTTPSNGSKQPSAANIIAKDALTARHSTTTQGAVPNADKVENDLGDKKKYSAPPSLSSLRVRPVGAPGNKSGTSGTSRGTQSVSASATLGSALAALVRSEGRGELPAPLQALPRAAQTALRGIAGREGYQPREIASIADAAHTVAGVMQYQGIPAGAVPGYFLGPDGSVDLNSKGVHDTLEQAGLSSWALSDDPQRRADLAYVIGVGLQLERTYNADNIRGAIGQAVSTGGTADTAADQLQMSPSAWGSRYGSVQSVVSHSPSYGLTNPTEVQSFIDLTQAHPIEELVEGRAAGLSAEQQALLDRVRARAEEVAIEEGAGSNSNSNGKREGSGTATSTLQSYLRDVRSIPKSITAPGVPGVPAVPGVPIPHVAPLPPKPSSDQALPTKGTSTTSGEGKS